MFGTKSFSGDWKTLAGFHDADQCQLINPRTQALTQKQGREGETGFWTSSRIPIPYLSPIVSALGSENEAGGRRCWLPRLLATKLLVLFHTQLVQMQQEDQKTYHLRVHQAASQGMGSRARIFMVRKAQNYQLKHSLSLFFLNIMEFSNSFRLGFCFVFLQTLYNIKYLFFTYSGGSV